MTSVQASCSLVGISWLANAYCIVPVHPSNNPQLLGMMRWHGSYLLVQGRPIYLHSCIADLVGKIAKQNYRTTFLMHYQDNFHTLGPLGLSVRPGNLDRSIYCFSALIISLHPDKLEQPCTYMGNGLDSITLQAHFPQEMFKRIPTQLKVWPHKSFCKWKKL